MLKQVLAGIVLFAIGCVIGYVVGSSNIAYVCVKGYCTKVHKGDNFITMVYRGNCSKKILLIDFAGKKFIYGVICKEDINMTKKIIRVISRT